MKELCLKEVLSFPKITEEREEQPSKASSSMNSREAGSDISVREVHFANAIMPIERMFPSEIELSDVHAPKSEPLISVTSEGIEISLMLLQP